MVEAKVACRIIVSWVEILTHIPWRSHSSLGQDHVVKSYTGKDRLVS